MGYTLTSEQVRRILWSLLPLVNISYVEFTGSTAEWEVFKIKQDWRTFTRVGIGCEFGNDSGNNTTVRLKHPSGQTVCSFTTNAVSEWHMEISALGAVLQTYDDTIVSIQNANAGDLGFIRHLRVWRKDT